MSLRSPLCVFSRQARAHAKSCFDLSLIRTFMKHAPGLLHHTHRANILVVISTPATQTSTTLPPTTRKLFVCSQCTASCKSTCWGIRLCHCGYALRRSRTISLDKKTRYVPHYTVALVDWSNVSLACIKKCIDFLENSSAASPVGSERCRSLKSHQNRASIYGSSGAPPTMMNLRRPNSVPKAAMVAARWSRISTHSGRCLCRHSVWWARCCKPCWFSTWCSRRS